MSKNTYANIIRRKETVLQWGKEWADAFENPETTGVFFIWGQSGNGKSNFCAQLAKELARIRIKVFYNSLEEKFSKTFKKTLQLTGMAEVKRNILFGHESLEELDVRLSKPKAPKAAFIDSVQATGAKRSLINAFIRKHSHSKLLVFISQTEGKKPRGGAAGELWFRADLKIWVEGFKAISHGRYNQGGRYTVWKEQADKYWGASTNTGK